MLKRILSGAIYFILIGAALALTIIKAFPQVKIVLTMGAYSILSGVILIILGCVAASFISVIIHEITHFLVGKILGFKCVSFKILKFELIKTVRSANKSDSQKKYRTLSYGSCEMISTKEGNYKKRLIIVTISALIVSLLCTIAFLILLLLLNNISPLLYLFISPAFLISFNIFISSAYPQDNSGKLSDGALIVELIKNSNEATIILALLNIQTQLYLGKTPSEIDKDLYFNLPVLADDNAIMQSLFFNRYFYHIDCGEYNAASNVSTRLLDNSENLSYRDGTMLYLNIVFDLIMSSDLVRAKAGFSIVERDLTNSITDLRVKAYYTNYVLKNTEETKSIIEQINDTKEPLEGIKKMELKLVSALK